MSQIRRLILLFIIMSLVGVTWQFWLSMGIPIPTKYYVLLQFLSLPAISMAALKAISCDTSIPKTNSHNIRAILLGAYVLFLLCYGVIRGNRPIFSITEAWVYITFVCFLMLGRYDWVWDSMEKPLLLFFWICFIMVLIGLSRPMMVAPEGAWGEVAISSYSERAAAASVGSRISTTLEIWPLLFSLSFFKRRTDIWRVLGLCTIIAYFILSVVFQFRSRSMVTGAYLLMAIIVIPVVHGRVKIGAAITIIILMSVSLLIASRTASFSNLLQRFGQGDNWSDRKAEIVAMFSSLSVVQWIIGKGMGGNYAIYSYWSAGEYAYGYDYRGMMHCGALSPYLKGGLIMSILYYSFYLKVFSRKPSGWHFNRINTAAMTVLPIYMLYLAVVPHAELASFMYVVMSGMACARMATPALQSDMQDYYEYLAYHEQEEHAYPAHY